MKQVTKKMVSAMRYVAYENLKSNFTKDEWESFFAGGRNRIFLTKVYDNKKAVYDFFTYETQMNSVTLKNLGLAPDGVFEIMGVVDRQTKTFTPIGVIKWRL